MRRAFVSSVLSACLDAVVVAAAEVVYVTDLTIFTSLAPCAASALSENVMELTYSDCPLAVTDLQSCACTKDQNFASISSAISLSVSYSCGSTASEDQASVATVLGAYCNQNSIPAFPTPATPVSVYITDIPEMSDLAPCAFSAVSEAVQEMTYTDCPPDATALASCACSKNQNSLQISQIINTSAKYSCSSHTADISSAQAMFAAYCAMNDGTTSFPTATNPPGDMSYYVTALTQFAALAPCAASALSYAVLAQTYYYCPAGPQALASCACIKDGISISIKSTISSDVKYSCDSTATEDVSSAIEVFNFYCSAANGEATAAGVSESISQSSAPGATGAETGAAASDGSSKPTGAGTGTTGADSGAAGSTSSPGTVDSKDKTTGNGPSGAVIGGAVAGAIVALAGLGILVFFLVRNSRRKQAAGTAGTVHHGGQNTDPNHSPDYAGKSELAGNPLTTVRPASPSASMLKVNPPAGNNVSPVSPHGAWTPPPPNQAELQGQSAPYPPMPMNAAELTGQGQGSPYPPNRPELASQSVPGYPQPNRPELMGQQAGYPVPNRPEFMGQPQGYPQAQGYPMQDLSPQEAHGQPVYEAPGQQSPYVAGPYQQPGHGQQPSQSSQLHQQQPPQSGWSPVAELDGRYPGQAR